ncbi:MAG: hypothetical protein JJU05_18845 [Verrucomicrobia bacterium]|nr:hypothetical protein [Verrucomicrobiota bacterium]MCH8525974.1 hypothetical protein [Kiritimatiellia bacterium]
METTSDLDSQARINREVKTGFLFVFCVILQIVSVVMALVSLGFGALLEMGVFLLSASLITSVLLLIRTKT